jgi:hypothetical protein
VRLLACVGVSGPARLAGRVALSHKGASDACGFRRGLQRVELCGALWWWEAALPVVLGRRTLSRSPESTCG